MAKVMMYIGEAALVAGAIAMTVVTGGGGAFLAVGALEMTISAANVASMAAAMGAMGAGMLMSSISSAIQGGGVASSQSVKNPAASRTTIYGQTRVNGTVIYMSSIGYVINQVVAWASHPCQSVDYIYLDGRELYFSNHGHNAVAGAEGFCDENTHYDPSGNSYCFKAGSNYHIVAYSSLGSYAGHWISQLGAGVSSVGGDQNFRAGDGNWGANCTLNGICATWVGAASNATMFNNIPQIKAAIHGKCSIYDPRKGALNSDGTVNAAYTGWTDNAALVIADFLVNSDYGMGFTWAEIDLPQLITAANICDQQVPLATNKFGFWAAHYTYYPNQIILDSNGRQQTCTGYFGTGVDLTSTSGGSHPTWMTSPGQVTYDNQIMWTAGALGTGYSESQYTINGMFDWATAPGDTLTQMLEACAGRISVWNGQLKIYPAAWYGTTVSYNEADIIDKISFKQKKSRDLCNAVRAKFLCPSYPYAVSGYDRNHKDTQIFDGQYQPTDCPEYAQDANHGYTGIANPTSDINLLNDGGIKLYQDRSYSYVTSVGQCQRLMKIYLLRNRQKWSGTIRVNAKGLQNVPNDVIQLTLSKYGWTNKLFEITEVRHVPHIEDGKAPLIYWEFDLVETDPSIYTWSTAEERGVTNTSSPSLLDSTHAAPVTGLTLESDISTAVVGLDGIVTPRILVTWTEPVDTFVTAGGSIIIEYQKVGDTGWTPAAIATGSTTRLFIPHVIAGQSYNVQVSAAHAGGASSDWVGAGPITVGNNISGIASPTVLNPDFELGDTGWTKQNGWAIGQTVLFYGGGSKSATCSAGSGTSALTNIARTSCTPGQVYSAQCMASVSAWPANIGVDGTVAARVVYYDRNGVALGWPNGNFLTNNGAWMVSKCVATAPVGAVTVGMDIACYGHSLGTWFVDACQLAFVGDNTSSSLNGQGSILPNQPIPLSYTTTSSSITINVAAMSLLRSDGSTFSVIATSKAFTGLGSSTSYYFYPYVSVADGKLYFTNPSPPQTSGSSLYKMQTALDGRIPISEQIFATSAAAAPPGGGTGGDGTCPESEELVEEQTRGIIMVKDVVVGDYLKGKCFATGGDVFRRVIQIMSAPASIWRKVDGHRVSPCEPIWHEGAWKPAFQATGSTIDSFNGLRMNLSLDNDNYDEQNYFLVDGSPLLIHNNIGKVSTC